MSLALFQSKKQRKISGNRGGLIAVSVTPLINEMLNMLSKSHELNEKLGQLAEIELGENDCWKHAIIKQIKNIMWRGACSNRMWDSATKRCLPVSGSYRLCWFMFLRNYLADDEKSKEILPEHTIAIAIPSGAKEQGRARDVGTALSWGLGELSSSLSSAISAQPVLTLISNKSKQLNFLILRF